jgi:hypothetical protein
MTQLSRTIEMEERRCYECGRFWMLERGLSGRCPHCAENKADDRHAELEVAHRTISALRGTITKLRKGV